MIIYVDGLERSGNTFLAGAMGYTLGTEVISLGSHRISTLKEAKKDSLFLVPVRDVVPSIVSAKVYRDYLWQNNMQTNERTGNPEELITRYTEYTEYLLDNDNFFIAPFHEFTKDHNKVADVIAKNFSEYSVVQRLTAKEIIERVGENPQLDNAYLGNFPREHAKENEEVKQMFLSEYKNEIDYIQSNIDELYKRYYREEAK